MGSTTISHEHQDLYQERRAERISRGRERRTARDRKQRERVVTGFGALADLWPAPRHDPPPAARPTAAPVDPGNATAFAGGQRGNAHRQSPPIRAARLTERARAEASPGRVNATAQPNATAQSAAPPRREERIAEFVQRREQALQDDRREARMRIAREGAERALADAHGALAHPLAAPWQRHREALDRALAGGQPEAIRHSALAGARGAAADAARTSRRAPDSDMAHAACVAFLVIAAAPRAATRGRRAQRARPRPARPFWR
jgi:hypothetical protein